jgi:hypothetical protein
MSTTSFKSCFFGYKTLLNGYRNEVMFANKTFLYECSLTNGCLVNISFIGEFQPLDDKKNEKKSSVSHTKELC